MKRFYLAICMLLLFGCEKKDNDKPESPHLESEKTTDIDSALGEQGTVITTLSLKNIPYQVFFFKITQILLIDSSSNKSIALTSPNNVINIDYSSMEKKSLILAINKHIPAGVYDRILVLISMENSLITASNQFDKSLPLVDAALNSIPEERSTFTVESYIGNQKKLTIDPQGIHHLDVSIDIEASTKYVPLPGGRIGIMFTPQVNAKIQTGSSPIHLAGEIENITDNYLTLLHPHKIQSLKPEHGFNYAYSHSESNLIYDGEKKSQFEFTEKMYWSYIDAQLHLTDKGFDIQIKNAFLSRKRAGFKLFQGAIIKSSGRDITLSGLYLDTGYSGYPIQRKLINKTFSLAENITYHHEGDIDLRNYKIQPTPGQKFWAIVDTNSLLLESIFIKPSKILGHIKQDTNGQAYIHPLSYNNVDALSANYRNYYPSSLRLNDTSSMLTDNQLTDMTGYQLSGDEPIFMPLKSTIITKASPLLFSISMPSIPVINSMRLDDNGQLDLLLDPEIHNGKALLKTRYINSGAQHRTAGKIESIAITQTNDIKLSVLIDGTDPVQSFQFNKTVDFHAFIKDKITSDTYIFNEINFTGTIEDSRFNAINVSVVFINKETINTGRNPYDDDDDDDDDDESIATAGKESKLKNFLSSAMPIIVPLGATILITTIFSTITGLFDGTYAAIKLSSHRKEMRKLIIEEREGRLQQFITDMNNKYKTQQKNPFYNISDILNHGEDKEKLTAIKKVIEENRQQLIVLRDNSSAKGTMKEFIRAHNTLLTYLDGFEEMNIEDSIVNANEKYKDLVKISDDLHESLKDYINKNVLTANNNVIAKKIASYSDNLKEIFLTTNIPDNILSKEALEKSYTPNRDRLTKEFEKIRSIRARF